MGGSDCTPSESERIMRGEKIYADENWQICHFCNGSGENANGTGACCACRGKGEVPIGDPAYEEENT